MKLYLDPGHGGTDPGALGNGLKEKDLTLDLALRIRSVLEAGYEGIEVKMSRTSDVTKSLSARTNEANAWKADFYMSIHINAFNGAASGYEDFIHNSLDSGSQTAKYQDIIHSEIIKLIQLNDRGKKKANFHVLRETRMPAFLSENGFIDNKQDAGLLKQADWRQKAAEGHAKGIAKAFNLKAKSQPDSGTLFKVIAGSFKQKNNAEERKTELDANGIASFIVTAEMAGQTWYRIQTGAFSTKENAEIRVAELKKLGFEAFIESAAPATDSRNPGPPTPPGHMPKPEPKPAPAPPAEPKPNPSPVMPQGYSVMGPTILSPVQMDAFVKTVNPAAPELGRFYSELGRFYGVRGDIAFAQAIIETNYFRFTGTVKPDQNNYAGIGTTGPDQPGANFKNPEEGVLAHIQHLYAYGTTEPLPPGKPLADPRFSLVKRGSAPTWRALNGRWAVPGTTYSQSIFSVYQKNLIFAANQLKEIEANIKPELQ